MNASTPRAGSTPTDRSAPAASGDGAGQAVAASYEAALAELEGLVADLEGGRLELEASLAAYQRGTALLRYCQAQLAAAEQQVRVLEGDALVALDEPDAPG